MTLSPRCPDPSARDLDAPLSHTLERDRLRRRERRLALVVRELRARAEIRRSASGTVPEPLGRAIADFQAELRAVRAALRG